MNMMSIDLFRNPTQNSCINPFLPETQDKVDNSLRDKMDSIRAAYVKCDEKLKPLKDSLQKLDELHNVDTSNMDNSLRHISKALILRDKIINSMRKIDPKTIVNKDIILNPLSKDLSSQKAQEARIKFTYATNQVALIAYTEVAEANQQLINSLEESQKSSWLDIDRPLLEFLKAYGFRMPESPEMKAISQHKRTLAKIERLTEEINFFEDQQRSEDKVPHLGFMDSMRSWVFGIGEEATLKANAVKEACDTFEAQQRAEENVPYFGFMDSMGNWA